MNQIVRAFKAWQYRGGRPQRWARIENRLWEIVFAAGFWNRAATLEVCGRKSGRLISFPVAVAEHQGERYGRPLLRRFGLIRYQRSPTRGVAAYIHADDEEILEALDALLRAFEINRNDLRWVSPLADN